MNKFMTEKTLSSRLEFLTELCMERIRDYQELDIYGKKVLTPYFINTPARFFTQLMRNVGVSSEKLKAFHDAYKERKIPYGWYQGKGTPKEITFATTTLSEKMGLSLRNASPEVIRQFMKLYGLGIDCSGFIYQTLSYAFSKIGKLQQFNDSLSWENPKFQTTYRAGVFVFAGEASKVIMPQNVSSLDIICFKKGNDEYGHIALVVRQNGEFMITQSEVSVVPDGVNLSNFSADREKPHFGFKPEIGKSWQQLYKEGTLEFRRLKILD